MSFSFSVFIDCRFRKFFSKSHQSKADINESPAPTVSTIFTGLAGELILIPEGVSAYDPFSPDVKIARLGPDLIH